MKTLGQLKTRTAAILLFIIQLVLCAPALAQKDVDVDIDIGRKAEAPWYGAWWVWVVGLALFTIIIVAIISATSAAKKK